MVARTRLAFLTFWWISAALRAQSVIVGTLPPDANTPLDPLAPPYTAFSLGSAAMQSGIVNSASFAFSAFPCSGAVKIKFFHRATVFNLLAQRGPFDVDSAIQTVPIDPPVSLQPGDVIAITVLTTCGTPLVSVSGGSSAVAPGDYGGGFFSPSVLTSSTLALRGAGTATPFSGVSRVIPVVYTGSGAFSSSFRTEILLHNSSAQLVSGLLISLIAGPAIRTPFPQPYAVPPGATVILSPPTLFGGVEIVPAVGPAPAVAVRISSDIGTAGTVGFSVPVVSPAEALQAGDAGSLIGPADPVNFRFNIGFVALSTARVDVTLRDQDGHLVKELTVTIPTFSQVNAEQLFGVPLPPAAGIDLQILSGQVLIYGVAADNHTNDGSFQLASRMPS